MGLKFKPIGFCLLVLIYPGFQLRNEAQKKNLSFVPQIDL
jgi:hypothetical protein